MEAARAPRRPAPAAEEGYPPIGDYAIIGDCRTAALVSRTGSIDWLALPRFDSPTCFAALLDARRGGCFRIRPTSAYRTERRYVGHTNVLETTFHTAGGELRLVDLMPIASEAEKRRELLPEHEILRRVECVHGEVEVEVHYAPRPDYARVAPRLRQTPIGWLCEHRGMAVVLRGDIPLEPVGTGTTLSGRTSLRGGDVRFFSLVGAGPEPAISAPLGEHAEERIARSVRWWEEWAAACTYEGPWKEAVVRSALTLKLMTFAPSGAIIAAATTSLPEEIGGVRNWDYRFCWLRDASMTMRALLGLGYAEEGQTFLGWLLHATRLTQPELQILYDVYGETRLAERELDHLDGYRGSRPIRIGNGAAGQLQLDTYGAVVDAAYQFVRNGGSLERATRRVLTGFGEVICRLWQEADEGIWELRSGPRHHTLSRAMCWVTLDRLLRLHHSGHLTVPAAQFEEQRQAIRDDVETRGYNAEIGSYVTFLNGGSVDASLLLLPLYGYTDAADPRMRSTTAVIRERLARDGLLSRYRYDDGLPGTEGAFAICNFWAAECLARQGAFEDAVQVFERILRCANDVGLFAEEVDPETDALLGNFPQAYTHVGLIDAALCLTSRLGRRARPRPGQERGRRV